MHSFQNTHISERFIPVGDGPSHHMVPAVLFYRYKKLKTSWKQYSNDKTCFLKGYQHDNSQNSTHMGSQFCNNALMKSVTEYKYTDYNFNNAT